MEALPRSIIRDTPYARGSAYELPYRQNVVNGRLDKEGLAAEDELATYDCWRMSISDAAPNAKLRALFDIIAMISPLACQSQLPE